MLDTLKRYFSKDKQKEKKDKINKLSKKDFESYTKPKELQREQKKIVVPDVYSNKIIDNNKPSILVMDDFVGMAQLINDELDRVQCCNITKDYNIILATGLFAAFSVENMIKNKTHKIDIAFLDITLGGVVKGIEYDGIDVAIMLKKYNKNCVIKFVTGHTLNKHNPELFKFIEKFETFFNTKMDDTEIINFNGKKVEIYKHVINKNGNRLESLGAAVQEFEGI